MLFIYNQSKSNKLNQLIMDWKAIMNELPEELQYEVTTFIPSKTVKITDAFVKWYKNTYPGDEFLGIKMDPEAPSEEGNLGIELAQRESFGVYRSCWIVGPIDSMRREWFSSIEGIRRYHEEEGNTNEDETWDEWVWGSFVVDETTYYVAEA